MELTREKQNQVIDQIKEYFYHDSRIKKGEHPLVGVDLYNSVNIKYADYIDITVDPFGKVTKFKAPTYWTKFLRPLTMKKVASVAVTPKQGIVLRTCT
jgi:hypothetical protein